MGLPEEILKILEMMNKTDIQKIIEPGVYRSPESDPIFGPDQSLPRFRIFIAENYRQITISIGAEIIICDLSNRGLFDNALLILALAMKEEELRLNPQPEGQFNFFTDKIPEKQ